MGSFTNCIKTRLKPQDRGQLLRDLFAEMGDKEVVIAINEALDALAFDLVDDIINDQVDRLNNAGYDWGCCRNGDVVR